MSQDVLSIFEALGHLLVIGVQCLAEWHDGALSLLVDVGHQAVVRIEQDLRVILEVNLDNFVAETEHDGVARPHPFLDVD